MTIPPIRGNVWRYLALVAALLFIAFATLVPEVQATTEGVAILCIRCGALGAPDLILNVVLFIPVGIALASLGATTRRALWVGLGLSFVIEALQLVIPGRATTLRDVLCNGAGAWLGAVIALNLARWVAPSRATSVRLAVATAAAVLTVAATGWLFAFAPSAPPYYGHWSPKQEHLEPWNGTVSSAALDGLAVPSWRVEHPERLGAAIADGFTLEITGIGGARTRRLGGIVTLSDAAMHEVFLVGPHNADLVVRVRRRAASFRFGAPEMRFHGLMLKAPAGAPFNFRIESSMAQTCATLNGAHECTSRPAAGSPWVLLLTDSGASATARILLNAFTLGLLAFPTGLLLLGVAPSHAWSAAFVLVAGIAVSARATGLAPLTLLEWASLLAGLVAGLVLNRLVTREGPLRAPAPEA